MKETFEFEIKGNIKDAAKDVEKLADELKGGVKETKELTKATSEGGKGFKGLTGSVKKLGSGLKALGVGLILAAFTQLKEIFGQNQRVADGFKTTTEFLSIAFNDFFRFLSNNIGTVTGFFKDLFENPQEKIKQLGNIIKQRFINTFKEATEVLGLAGKAFGQLIKGQFQAAFDTAKEAGKQVIDVYTGVDGSFEKVKETIKTTAKGIKEYTKSTFDAAKSNVELDKSAALAESRNRILLEQFDRQAEVQRQIRDDESKSMPERIAANEKLGELLKEQKELMLANADISVDAAQKELDKNKENVELQIALNEAIAEREGIIAQVTGFESEQLTNTISLKREQQDLEKELQEQALENIKEEADKRQELHDLEQERKQEQMAAFSQLSGALGDLLGESKAMAVAQATIDTIAGATKAFSQTGVAGFVTGAAITLAGIANVRKILATKVPKEKGGGGSIPSATGQAPSPQMTSGAFTLTTPQEAEPPRAFVVSDDITNNQNKLANIRRRATI
jgi:hypothetical protein